MQINTVRNWSRALAPATFTYGTASAGLSSAAAYADTFPAGGVRLDPFHGIIRNPEWTGNFGPRSVMGQLQPILAGVSAGLHFVRAGFEIAEAVQTGDRATQWAGALDLSLGITSAMSILDPGIGGVATLGLLAARAAVAMVADR